MASGEGNLLLQNIRGHIGKELVIKQYGNKIVITKYPRIRKQKPTALKKIYEARFAAALKYARAILRNDELKKQYKARLKPGQRVYNYAISEYLKLAKAGKLPSKV